MKRLITLVFICGTLNILYAQEGSFKLGFRLAPYTNIASVNDNDPTPSNINRYADGLTVKEENSAGVGVSFFFDYFFTEHIGFSSGLWFTQKNFAIRNYDGWNGNGQPYPYYGQYAYSGVSFYKSTYLQIPLLLKFVSGELAKNLRIYATFGPTIDLRVGEKVDGNDYAHYWNMSKHDGRWASRDRNANGRPMKLFNPVDFTLYFSAGVTYGITEKFEIFGGIMANKGFVNAINPKLRFEGPDQIKVNTDVSWKSFLVGAELGVTYNLTK